MPRLAVVAVLLFALLVAACVQTPPTTARQAGRSPAAGELLVADVRRERARGVDVAPLVGGTNGFATDLYGELAARTDGNLVLSGYSVAVAFGMARAGAAGETADEIDEVFGFDAAGDDLHPAFNRLQRMLDERGRYAVDVEVANAIFGQTGFPVGADFLDTLARHYGSGLRAVDFAGDTRGATEAINAWVEQATRGRIPVLFTELTPQTRVVLANAVYLKAGWTHPFAPDATRPSPFRTAAGATVQAETMHQVNKLRYARLDGLQAVELPYTDGRLAMWVLLPDGAGPPSGRTLTPQILAEVERALTDVDVDLALPRWDFSTETDLVPPLKALGVHQAFVNGDADFSGIAPGLFIAQALQRADITVDEEGTEAAAATGLAFEVSGPAGRARVTVDRPFQFVIRHRDTGTILFLGHVTDPTATG